MNFKLTSSVLAVSCLPGTCGEGAVTILSRIVGREFWHWINAEHPGSDKGVKL